MPDIGVPFYSQPVGDDSLLRVKGAMNPALPPDLVYGLGSQSTTLKTGTGQDANAGRQSTPVGQRIIQEAQVPSVPQLDPEYARVKTEYDKYSSPNDPSKPEYRMGIGGRIMGTLTNFLSGMRGGGPMVYTGKGATNNQYGRDESLRVQRQVADRTKLGAMDEDFARRQKIYENELARHKDQVYLDNLKDQREIQQSQAEQQAQNEREAQQQERENQLAAMGGKEAQSRLNILSTLDLSLTPAERQDYIQYGILPGNSDSSTAIQKRQQITQQKQKVRPKAPTHSNPINNKDNPYR